MRFIKVWLATTLLLHMVGIPLGFFWSGVLSFGWPDIALWKDIFWALFIPIWHLAPGMFYAAVLITLEERLKEYEDM